MEIVYGIIIGMVAGILSGFLGIGGAVVIIPLLIIFFNYSQHLAQGTSLAAMLPPIGLLAAYQYWKSGNVNLKMAIIIGCAFIFGAFFGAVLADKISSKYLQKCFGILLLIISVKMIIK